MSILAGSSILPSVSLSAFLCPSIRLCLVVRTPDCPSAFVAFYNIPSIFPHSLVCPSVFACVSVRVRSMCPSVSSVCPSVFVPPAAFVHSTFFRVARSKFPNPFPSRLPSLTPPQCHGAGEVVVAAERHPPFRQTKKDILPPSLSHRRCHVEERARREGRIRVNAGTTNGTFSASAFRRHMCCAPQKLEQAAKTSADESDKLYAGSGCGRGKGGGTFWVLFTVTDTRNS